MTISWQWPEADCRPVSVPGGRSERSVTLIEGEDAPVAVLVHDPRCSTEVTPNPPPGRCRGRCSRPCLDSGGSGVRARARRHTIALHSGSG
jgi:hypothetical protein